MVRPGVNVTTSAILGTPTAGDRLGTWFVAGITESGPVTVDPTRPLLSLAAFVQVYGGRVGYGTLYDAVDAFFQLGGNRLNVARVVGPAASKATLNLKDKAVSALDTLQVDAKGPGDYGARIKIAVTAGVASNTYVLTTLFDNVVQEISPELATPADAVLWSQSSNYVTITDLASATAAPNNIPKVATAASLVGGDDDRSNIGETQWTAALARFGVGMGPGLVSQPTRTTSTAHAQTIAHGAANNREALCDAVDGVSASTTATLADGTRAAASSDEYGSLYAPWLTFPGVTTGTLRRIPPCAVAAGLISRQCQKGKPNIPAANALGLVHNAVDFAQPAFTDAERQTLNAAGVCVFHRARNTNVISLFGYRTLDLTLAWQNLSNQLLRLMLTEEALNIGETFLFDQIDGRGHTLAQFNGALRAMLQTHWINDELFGATADDAYQVDTGPAVNTPVTLADNQLIADISVRMSPFAELVNINIVKVPITQSLVA